MENSIKLLVELHLLRWLNCIFLYLHVLDHTFIVFLLGFIAKDLVGIFFNDWTKYFFIFMFSIILSLCFLWDLLQKIWWALELQSCILSENWAKRSFIFEEKIKNITGT